MGCRRSRRGTLLSNKAILTGGGLDVDDVKAEYLGQTEAMAALQNGIIDGQTSLQECHFHNWNNCF